MEESLNDRVISDKERETIKRLLDYDEAKELFKESQLESSIAESFIKREGTNSLVDLYGSIEERRTVAMENPRYSINSNNEFPAI